MIATQEAHVLTAKRMGPVEGAHKAVIGNFWKRIGGHAVSAQEVGPLAQILHGHAEVIEYAQQKRLQFGGDIGRGNRLHDSGGFGGAVGIQLQ